MESIKEISRTLREPTDYFQGTGSSRLPIPTGVLLFSRTTKTMLQQESLQNRSHHRFVLILNLETIGHVHVDNHSLPFNPGQAILVFPYQFHHFSHLESKQINWLFCTFELDSGAFLEPLRNREIKISKTTLRRAEALLTMWMRKPADLQAEQLQVSLLQLLLSLKQNGMKSSAAAFPFESKKNLLRSINKALQERSGQPVSVTDLAEALDLSSSRLRTRFKQTAGVPLGAYIQNYRLNKAMALLRTTDRPIADIAEAAGFGSPQAFSRTFKKETGQTPRNYRNPI